MADQSEEIQQLPTNLLWKLFIHTFAEKASGGRWKPYPYLVYISEIIQEAILEGQRTKIQQFIILEAPVRHGKSWLIDWWLPIWFLEMWPHLRVMLGAYNSDFADTWGRKVLDEFNNNDLLTAKISPDKCAASDFNMVQGGNMRTFGFNGSVTGFGADLLLVDDAVKNVEEAQSEVLRDKTYDQFMADILTRLEPGGTLIVTFARRHEDDLIGRLLANKDFKCRHIHLPAIAEANDELGRKVGEALCPERYNVEGLMRLKKMLPTMFWNSLFQQRPSSAEGNLFKMKNWRHWDKRTLPKEFDDCLISMDTNVEEGAENDNTSIQAWGKKGSSFYLLDQVLGCWGFTQQCQQFKLFCEKYPNIYKKIIEKKANGPAIQNALKKFMSGIIMYPEEGVKMENKFSRAVAVEPFQTAGNIFVPADENAYPWVEDFKSECAKFPKGKHDDQVDAMSQAINVWQGYNSDWLDKILSQ